ncbi:heterokaryon incompatibility protein-domain-containing protein [Tricladium varicosporioides]|nr:heterokaryon incompatibility protein-domain-containing protein [Hymenoscyphus varicosporioides]
MMRLLNAQTMEILEFFGNAIPPYVILSHTWENDEVTFQDMRNGEAGSKQGFAKVARCCEEAVKNGIEYAWIDTCCIDKTSSSELSEAINSMFQWYKHAVKCYAYLSDLPSQLSEDDIKTRLPSCRWFTRGWTLQELLAPRELLFFARDWTPLGERSHWATLISAATCIHEGALTGIDHKARAFSVAQKISWASKRSTTREEDMAYCLMGLFNVHMPLLYGEGSQAFVRLQEEIMKKSDDQTIFAWSQSDNDCQYRGLLASSPKEFENCTSIAPFRNWKSSQSYENTNAGLRLTTSLLRTQDDSVYSLILQCYDQRATERMLGIDLVKLSPAGDQFARIHKLQYHIGIGCQFLPQRTIYIRNDVIRPEAHTLSEIGKLIHFQISITGSHQIIHTWPPDQWDSRYQILKPPRWSDETNHRLKRPDPGLFNWSWHVALLLSSTVARDTAVFEGEELIVVIGYNGRDGQCWCDMALGSSRDLEDVWNITPYSGATKMSSLGVDGNNRAPSAHITLLGPDGGTLPKSAMLGWNGQPFMALIRID